MTEYQIEGFIKYMREKYKGKYCVYEDGRTFECCDCTLCWVTFENKIREELKEIRI